MSLQKNHRLSLPPFRIDDAKLAPHPATANLDPNPLKIGHFVDEQNWPNSLPLASLIGEYPIWCRQAIEKYTTPGTFLDYYYSVIFQPDNQFGDRSTVIDVPNLVLFNYNPSPLSDNIANNVDGIKDYLNAKKITIIKLHFAFAVPGRDEELFVSKGLPPQEIVICPNQLVGGGTDYFYAVRSTGEEFVGGNLLVFSLFPTTIAAYGSGYSDGINEYFTPCTQALNTDLASLDSCLPSFASYEHHLYFLNQDKYIGTGDQLAYPYMISLFNSLASRNFIQHGGYNDYPTMFASIAADLPSIARNFFG